MADSPRISLRETVERLRRDAGRYATLGGWYRNAGFWVGATHRATQWGRSLPTGVGLPVLVPARVMRGVWELALNATISPDADIGPGLCLIHPRNVMVGASKIGTDCLIFHEVTVGTNASSGGQSPTIGDHVNIYVGARVLGKLKVGDGAKVGANCVVLSSVSAGSSVVPAANRVVAAAVVARFGPQKTAAACGDESLKKSGASTGSAPRVTSDPEPAPARTGVGTEP